MSSLALRLSGLTFCNRNNSAHLNRKFIEIHDEKNSGWH